MSASTQPQPEPPSPIAIAVASAFASFVVTASAAALLWIANTGDCRSETINRYEGDRLIQSTTVGNCPIRAERARHGHAR